MTSQKNPTNFSRGSVNNRELKKLYNEYKNIFVNVEKNYGKFMYILISRMVLIGKKLDKKYTIKHNLCKDLGIKYERYKFYSKYRHITIEMQKMIDDNKIRPITMLNIVHRYPEKEWDKVIELEKKYKLTHHDLIELKRDDKYKHEKEWDKIFQEKGPRRVHDNAKINRRAITHFCNEIKNKLKNLRVIQSKTRAEIYDLVFKTYNVMGDWMSKHKKWDNPELLNDNNNN